MKKRIVSIVLCFVLLLSVLPIAMAEGGYTPGTYTATSPNGKMGNVTVDVEFSQDAILLVKVTDHSESDGIADPAIERIPAAIVEYQSLGVDTVTGATVTSDAILEAVGMAVEMAGATPKL